MFEVLRGKLLPATVWEQINLNLADQKTQSSMSYKTQSSMSYMSQSYKTYEFSQILRCKSFHRLKYPGSNIKDIIYRVMWVAVQILGLTLSIDLWENYLTSFNCNFFFNNLDRKIKCEHVSKAHITEPGRWQLLECELI